MPSERFDFPGGQGVSLAARLDRPAGPVRATALFAHCFTCGKDALAAGRIAAALAARGIATLRFDFTGLGGSEGDFANSGFSANVGDLVAAAAELRRRGLGPDLLIGHSLGGAAVLAAAERIPEARAVATIAAPFDTAHLLKAFGDSLGEIEAQGQAVVRLAERPFTITSGFVADLRSQDQARRIAHLGRPLLLLHAPTDAIVGLDNARQIFEAAHHPKSFVALDQADHLLTAPGSAAYAADIIATWAARYLPPAAAAEPLPTGQVVVSETLAGPLQQEIAVGPHRLLADEPVAVGGGDSGPGPYDLLLAALGACTAMTLRLYADRKALPLERVRVVLDHDKIHAQDCADCETREGMLDRIQRRIYLSGDLSDEDRARLLAIAERCPVHRTLQSEIKILTDLAAPW